MGAWCAGALDDIQRQDAKAPRRTAEGRIGPQRRGDAEEAESRAFSSLRLCVSTANPFPLHLLLGDVAAWRWKSGREPSPKTAAAGPTPGGGRAGDHIPWRVPGR